MAAAMRKFLHERAEDPLVGDVKGSNILDLLCEKLAQILLFFQNIWAFFSLDKIVDFLKKLWASFSLDKMIDFLKKLWASAVEKADELLPPEKRSEILHSRGFIGTVAVAVILTCLYCCCCRRSPPRCCCGGRSRMMKAPGMEGLLMPRDPFEANPTAYFRNLRAGKTLRLLQ